MDDASFESQLQDTFLEEALEMLEDTEAAFVVIESQPDNASQIDKIFRLVHTIKGGAHVAGFTSLGEFAHIFEMLLEALRKKVVNATAEVTDVLLEGNDRLKEFILVLRNDRSAMIDVDMTSSRILKLVPQNSLPPNPNEVITPVRAVSKEVPKDAISVDSISSSNDPLFLIVDDERSIALILEEILTEDGIRSILAESAKEALELLQTHKFDVVLTDLQMPEMDGYEFVTTIRRFNQFVPVAFVTGHSSREHYKEALKIGIDSFIEKPFSIEDVRTVALRLLRVSRLRSSMLALSKLSYRAYVLIEKLVFSMPSSDQNGQENVDNADKKSLDKCMDEIKKVTKDLLKAEREFKPQT